MDEDRHSDNGLSRHSDLFHFQTRLARSWLERGSENKDPFGKFLLFFAGFNALYFLWKVVDDVKEGEAHQIRSLVNRLGEARAATILTSLGGSVEFFRQRRPVERMDRRRDDPARGEAREGQRNRETLLADENPRECLNALAQILYLVRSNLAHGSKGGSGDDLEIVEASLPALKLLLEEALRMTQAEIAPH